MARRPAGRRRARHRAAARRRAGAVADRRQHPRSRRGDRRARRGCSTSVGRPRRIGLVLPDSVAKVSLVRFEQVPAKAQDLDQLVRWQVRRRAPFAIEDAQVSYVPGAPHRRRPRVRRLARAARVIVEGTRALCAEVGAHAGIVDLATLQRDQRGARGRRRADRRLAAGQHRRRLRVDRAPARRRPDFLPQPRRDTDGTLADLVHQTAMYYEDRLNGAGFARVLLAGAAGGRRAAGGATSSSCAAASRSGCGRRSRPSIRAPRRR